MAKAFEPTTPTAFVPELSVVVVELVGKSQPIRTSCAPKDEVLCKIKMRAIETSSLTMEILAHRFTFDRDDCRYKGQPMRTKPIA